jgi:TPR repeat protein
MKALFALLALASIAMAAEKDWQAKAVEKYPALGVQGSELNKRFVEAAKDRRKTDPNFFANQQWPLILADDLAEAAQRQTAKAKADENHRQADEAQAKAKQRQFLVAKAKAEQGDALAQLSLAMCYADGKGVAKDEAEAVKWLRKAAEQGEPIAQTCLATFYFTGKGVAKDVVEGYAWMSLSEPGFALAFEEEMTPREIGAGLKRAKELRAMIEAKAAK